MFLFKRLAFLWICFISTSSAFAATPSFEEAEAKIEAESAKIFKDDSAGMPQRWMVSVAYVSWQEQMSLTSGATSDFGFADFSGNAITLQRKFFAPESHHGFLAEGGLLYGAMTAAGAGGVLSYNVSNISWTGVEASVKYFYRLSAQASVAVGPLALSRQVSYPTVGTGTSGTSGASVNFGGLVEARAFLWPRGELILGIGKLIQNAAGLWSLGLGYSF